MDLQFDWDDAKATANVREHDARFEEAITIFGDPNAITIFDVAHSETADRFIDIGLSASRRVLVVVYTERGPRIRIIRRRRATLAERRQYEQGV